jgi:hypothetical protein
MKCFIKKYILLYGTILSGKCAVAGGMLPLLSLSYPKKESWQAQQKKAET